MNKKSIPLSTLMCRRNQACKRNKNLIEILDIFTRVWSHNCASSGFCKPACYPTGVIDWGWWGGGRRRWGWCSSWILSTVVWLCESWWRVRRRVRRHWYRYRYRRCWNWRWRWCHKRRWWRRGWGWGGGWCWRRRWRRRRRRWRRCGISTEMPFTVDDTHGFVCEEREKPLCQIKTTEGASRTLDSGLIYNLSIERKRTDGILDSCSRVLSITCYSNCFSAEGGLHLLQDKKKLDGWIKQERVRSKRTAAFTATVFLHNVSKN
jgi:hypothetical protein